MMVQRISILVLVFSVGCAAEVAPEDVGGAMAALVTECAANADCPGTHPTCTSEGLCVACTGDLNQDFQVGWADQSLFDSAFTSGDAAADIDRDGWLTGADQTLLDEAKASNDCVCDPDNTISGAYYPLDSSGPSTLQAGDRYVATLSYYGAIGVSRLLPFVTRTDYCGGNVIRNDGYGGPSIIGGEDSTGATNVTVYWKTSCSTPGGTYYLGLVDRITGRPVVEGVRMVDVAASLCGGGGGGGKLRFRMDVGDTVP